MSGGAALEIREVLVLAEKIQRLDFPLLSRHAAQAKEDVLLALFEVAFFPHLVQAVFCPSGATECSHG
jgi:hypothetical protein